MVSGTLYTLALKLETKDHQTDFSWNMCVFTNLYKLLLIDYQKAIRWVEDKFSKKTITYACLEK